MFSLSGLSKEGDYQGDKKTPLSLLAAHSQQVLLHKSAHENRIGGSGESMYKIETTFIWDYLISTKMCLFYISQIAH